MVDMVRWDLDVMETSLQTLEARKEELEAQRGKMQTQQSNVHANWQSPAGREYQARLEADMTVMGSVVSELNARITSLKRVNSIYAQCESDIQTAMGRLPH